jgi:hypothetical protein
LIIGLQKGGDNRDYKAGNSSNDQGFEFYQTSRYIGSNSIENGIKKIGMVPTYLAINKSKGKIG